MPADRQFGVAPRVFPWTMVAIHWTTAALMAIVVGLAWAIPDGPGQGGVVLLLHKSVGLTILALTALRLIVRRLSSRPPEESGMGRVEELAARLTHALLYLILIAMPLSGYLTTAAGGHPVSVFGVFDIPALLPASPALRAVAWPIHSAGQLAVYGAVGLHVLAAFYHLLVRRDGVMARMVPHLSGINRPGPRSAEARPGAR